MQDTKYFPDLFANWYSKIKTAQDVGLWGQPIEAPPEQTPTPEFYSGESFEQDLEYVETLPELLKLLELYKVDWWWVEFPTDKPKIMRLSIGDEEYVIDDDTYYLPRLENANEWVWGVNDASYYLPEVDENAEFWDTADGFVAYHGTTEENLDSIMETGLEPRCYTRGIENRGMGCAVFLSPRPEITDSYGGEVIAVDFGAMKADGYMPPVGGETPIEEAQHREQLASLLGLEDFYADVESGIEEDTIAVYDVIPPKYLTVI